MPHLMELLFVFFYFVQFLATNAIIIDTKLGQIEGIEDEFGSYIFRNIPYATPPVGALRWRPPKPLENNKFKGIFNGTAAGNACVQPSISAAMFINGSNGIMSEDCLTLGIQTPYQFDKADTQSLRKVLFWIHGGGLSSGCGYAYAVSSLAKNQDIVVVSINYRLGLGAFLIDPELYNSPTGNGGANAFLDMIDALKWTRDNIESYGGDPTDVTIAGESGGGWAVCGLILSPLAKNLFKRSIQMSGTCIDSLGKIFSREEAWATTQLVKETNNVTLFDEMRDMDLQVLTDTWVVTAKSLLPSVDGYVFPISTMELLDAGVANGESVMIGTVFRESFTEKPFNMGKPPQSLDELNEFYYNKLFDIQAQLMQEYYPEDAVYTKIWPYGKSEFESNVATLIQTVQITDCWVKCGSIWQADKMASHPITKDAFSVYFYQYGYIEQPYDQVSHGYDIVGLFGYDIDWISGGVEYSEEFVELTQNFFGAYVKGVVPMKDGVTACVQNGYYIQVVEDVKIVGLEDLDHIRDRCEVYKLFGDDIWRDPFCMGIYMEDVTPEQMERFTGNATENINASDATDSEQCVEGSCEKQEV